MKFSISLENFKILKFFNLWALRELGPWSEFPFLYRFTVLLTSGGSNSPWSEFWSEFPICMGMGVVPALSRDEVMNLRHLRFHFIASSHSSHTKPPSSHHPPSGVPEVLQKQRRPNYRAENPRKSPKIPARHTNSPYGRGSKKYPENT